MTPLQWLLLALGAALAILYTSWWYRTREEPVPGRTWAAALRSSALILAWLILLNPTWPAPTRSDNDRAAAVLDASYSMSRSVRPGGPSAWQLGLDSVARFESVWLFGGSIPQFSPFDSLPEAPVYSESRLAPVLRSAALADARRVTVFTDGAIFDATEATEEARRLGLDVLVVPLAEPGPEIGIASVATSRWVQAGDTVDVRAEIVAESAERDSVRVEIVGEEGRVRASDWVRVPDSDRFVAVHLTFAVSDAAGYQRFAVRIAGAPDLEGRDEQRPFYIRVTERPAGPMLVSLQPDWEPSFLIPNLDRLSDTPTTPYFLISDTLVRLEGYRRVSVEAVRGHARSAPLVVLQGLNAYSPAWSRDLVREAQRLLVMPTGSRAFELPGWGVRIGIPAQGEWYASLDLPSSPLALELAGFPANDLSPLLRVRAVEADRTWTPLSVQRLRRGEPLPAVVAGTAGARRWVVAAGEGYWRWAFRGEGRALYRALWTGLGGWLMEGRRDSEFGLEPSELVVVRDQPLRWRSPLEADSISVALRTPSDSTAQAATAIDGDSITMTAAPGRYRFDARAYRDGSVLAQASGPVEVEEFSPELLPRSKAAADSLIASMNAARRVPDDARRQFAMLGWPYLILIALFCAEWAVRRYVGLR